ncbi:30S ribosomal protein S28e [archaeon]|jgi:small subunit ribosomal protein S28e|nr:30S ribosomal protein S28e [archaeon]MBT3577938.1 30S ribosomal protein S28e [archaeon]MBT6820541.1 30S ribosomal protein S28e [archaeon]MBT6956079.1 30S ribosomal protein S28e [archaeon]MBT7025792.1 30S ribosomal protein S28e [archaeon]
MAKEQKKQESKQQKKAGGSKGSEKLTEEGAVPAIVEAVMGRTGTRGEITQVRCRILQGKNMGKSMRRNVRGPIKKRDILMLRETEIEARRIFKKINKGSQS